VFVSFECLWGLYVEGSVQSRSWWFEERIGIVVNQRELLVQTPEMRGGVREKLLSKQNSDASSSNDTGFELRW
jgi:hypothetical protein